MKYQKSKIKNSKIKYGFTLVEVSVAMAIFSLIMVATINFFGLSMLSYKNAKAMQKDVENAQFTMNLMAKTLRTSTILSCGGASCATGGGTYNSIVVYDYSQAKCIEFAYDNNEKKITTRSSSTLTNKDNPASGCSSDSWSNSQDMAANHVNKLKFYVVKSQSNSTVAVVGKAIISIEICSNASCSGSEIDKARIQSSLSLRDFSESIKR